VGYSAVADVAARLQRAFTPTSTPTDAQVTAWIAEIDGEIDAVLSAAGYAVPLTDGTAFLRSLSADGATYRTATSVYSGEGFNDSPRVENYRRDYMDRLKMLTANPKLAQGTSGQTVTDVTGQPDDDSDPLVFPPPEFTMARKF